jgi:hypothetical protein
LLVIADISPLLNLLISKKSPNAEKCDKWCRDLHDNDDSWKCYHHEILNTANVERLKLELETLNNEISHIIPRLNVVASKTSFNLKEDPRGMTDHNQANDTMSIHFDVTNKEVDEDTYADYSNRVSDELLLRGIVPKGSLNSRIKKLQDCLTQEWLLKSINASIQHSEKCSDKFFLSLLDCVPCILHMENRTGLKLFSMILREGLSNAIKGEIYSEITSEQVRINKYLSEVAIVCNCIIWGSEIRQTTWKVPYDSKKQVIDDITLDNNKTRVLCQNMQLILVISVVTGRYDKWKYVIEKYVSSMVLLRNKDDFSYEDIKLFQAEADYFFSAYIELVGRNGITNYFHLLGSGHISVYLFLYKNLYEHSQQGWEAFNTKKS